MGPLNAGLGASLQRPVFRYVVEGRAYLMAMVIAFRVLVLQRLAADGQRHLRETERLLQLLGRVGAFNPCFCRAFCCVFGGWVIAIRYFRSQKLDFAVLDWQWGSRKVFGGLLLYRLGR